MRFEWGPPRVLLTLAGVILILFAIGSDHASALNGGLLIFGVVLLLLSLFWTLRARGRGTGSRTGS